MGERWALLVVRELLLGPKRFTDLRAGLPNLSPDVLAQRLRELEESGVVRRTTLAPPAASRVYELTGRGHELEPVIVALGPLGQHRALPAGRGADRRRRRSSIALKTLFDPGAADRADASYELRLGEQHFRAARGRRRGSRSPAARAEDPDATIATDPATLATALWHGRDADEARRSGDLAVSGDQRAAARLLVLFPLPS